MKRFTILAIAALFIGSIATAQEYDATSGELVQATIGNPKLPDGSYIVKYDMEKGDWAENNDFEIDENFVFAIDITGSTVETFMKNFVDPFNPDAIPCVAYCARVTNPDIDKSGAGEIDGRLIKIKDNIYGATINLYQAGVFQGKSLQFGYNRDTKEFAALQPGKEVWLAATSIFFAYTVDENNDVVAEGISWYAANDQPIQFKTEAYTGTKHCDMFYKIDAEDCDPTGNWFYSGIRDDDGGWGSPWTDLDELKALTTTDDAAIDDVTIDAETIAVEYYNIQGQKLNAAPENGLYIQKAIKADGTVKASKLVK